VQLAASGVGATTLCCTYVSTDTAEPTDIRTYIVRVQPA
jgi:hypothetical protein